MSKQVLEEPRRPESEAAAVQPRPAAPAAGRGRLTRLLRGEVKPSLASFTGLFWVWVVYQVDHLDAIEGSRDGPEVRPLSVADLRSIGTRDQDLARQQIRRLERFGRSHAYGTFVDGALAHVAWLLPSEASRRDFPKILPLAGDEVEITGCFTFPEYRGKGIYPATIRALSAIARSQGATAVYLKTRLANRASRRGIVRAGCRHRSVVVVWMPPLSTHTRTFRIGSAGRG